MNKSAYKVVATVVISFFLVICSFMIKALYDVSSLQGSYLEVTAVNDIKIVRERPYKWVQFNDISPHVIGAITISEDWAFYDHIGVDVKEIYHAIYDYAAGKRGLRGASTITQQVAKNIFLSHQRSFKRKLMELFYTFSLELLLSKKEILTFYLNLIELGPNTYGVRSGASYYFNKDVRLLNPKEGAFLAMLLPSPIAYGDSFRKKALTVFAKSRIEAILKKMSIAKMITKDEYDIYNTYAFSWEIGEEMTESDEDLEFSDANNE